MRHFERFGTIVQFKRREKHPRKSGTFSNVAGFMGGGGGGEPKEPPPPCALRLEETLWLVEAFFKPINSNNRTINILIRRGWASYCAIIGGFQLLAQDKLFLLFRSSRSQMFVRIGALKNFAIFTGKHLCRASRIRNLGTRFFVHLIMCLRTRSCTSHFVHLK